MRKLPPRDKKGRFVKVPKPPPLDPELVKQLGSTIVRLKPPQNVLEELRPLNLLDEAEWR
jgi:hypothetical protein